MSSNLTHAAVDDRQAQRLHQVQAGRVLRQRPHRDEIVGALQRIGEHAKSDSAPHAEEEAHAGASTRHHLPWRTVEKRRQQRSRGRTKVGGQVISYPHGMMGVVTRRCFGGASTLSFPKVFGGTRAVALRGATIGMMHDRIVGQLLAGSPRLLAQWQAVAARQGQELEDLLADGTLDAVVRADQLAGEVDRFIAAVRKPRLHRTRRSTGVPVLASRRVGPRLVPPEQAR